MPNQPSRRNSSDVGRVFPSGVKIDKTPYGLGVFSFAFIPKGTTIARVPGEMIHDADYGSDYCIGAGEGKVLEPAPPFCYLNHSCEPNCQLLQYVREEDLDDEEELEVGSLTAEEMDDEEDENSFVDAEPEDEEEECFFGDGGAEEIDEEDDDLSDDDEEEEDDDTEDAEMQFEDDIDAEIWVESTRDILPGEELTIDYAWPADRATKCLCGSSHCRGWIVDPAELDELLNKTA
jgi:hypothetical protein